MESKRVTCPHCDFLFYPEEGVSLDDCPVCGRTVEVKPAPAPAPLPEADETICARLLFACNGHPHALIPWPHRLLHDAVAHITAQARRLAEAEAELAEVRSRNSMLAVQRADAVHLAKANPTQAYQRIQQFKERVEAAEAERDVLKVRVEALENALRQALEWDGKDDEGVDAVWAQNAVDALRGAEAK